MFDSSWWQEDTQTATVTVSYDEGDPAFLKADATNERVTLDLNYPGGAQVDEITFGMVGAGNDWWWASDSISRRLNERRPFSCGKPAKQARRIGPEDLTWF